MAYIPSSRFLTDLNIFREVFQHNFMDFNTFSRDLWRFLYQFNLIIYSRFIIRLYTGCI